MVELVSFNLFAIIFLVSLYILHKSTSLKSFNNSLLFLVSLSLLGSLFVIYNSVNGLNAFLDRREWPIVVGNVSSIEMKGIKTHEPEIHYKYKIYDEIYTGTTDLGTPLFGGSKSQKRVAQTILDSFNVGDTVTVFFNPADYSHSVLKVTPNWSVFIQYSFGLMLASIMLILIINRLFMNTGKNTL